MFVCIAPFPYPHLKKQTTFFLNRLLQSMIGAIDPHPAASEKGYLKSVPVYCIIYSSADTINCLESQETECIALY